MVPFTLHCCMVPFTLHCWPAGAATQGNRPSGWTTPTAPTAPAVDRVPSRWAPPPPPPPCCSQHWAVAQQEAGGGGSAGAVRLRGGARWVGAPQCQPARASPPQRLGLPWDFRVAVLPRRSGPRWVAGGVLRQGWPGRTATRCGALHHPCHQPTPPDWMDALPPAPLCDCVHLAAFPLCDRTHRPLPPPPPPAPAEDDIVVAHDALRWFEWHVTSGLIFDNPDIAVATCW